MGPLIVYVATVVFACAGSVAAAADSQLSAAATPSGARPTGFTTLARPLLEAQCFACHGPKTQKGDVDFSRLRDDRSVLRARKLWKRAIVQVETGEMPPESADRQPTPQERQQLLDWMKGVGRVDPNDPSSRDPGPPVLRRLTAVEYDRTLRDLLGITFDAGAGAGMADEPTATGFTNLAVSLNLSPAQMDTYFEAADRALERVFAAADPTLADGAKLDGAARSAVVAAHDRLVFERPGEDLKAEAAATQVLSRFAGRADRRPARPDEVRRLLALFQSRIEAGDGYETALRRTMKPILVSPKFLYRIERELPSDAPYPVTDFELATRLSYFLWASMPDEELTALAARGTLSEAATLDQQVARMLADPRARSLTDLFGEQWLQLGKVANARPSTEFFPGFNGNVRRAMHDEASEFFDHLRTDDRPLLDLIDSNYTYLNADLATHYGIAGVSGKQIHRVELAAGAHRGGLLGMGAVLAMTSHTSRTSPTLRGKYVLDVIFGTPPAPPPANVGQLREEGKKGEVRSFREQLAQHASNPTCAACHKKLDPLGFALDRFNAVGQWRDDAMLDTSGQLPGGVKLTGLDDLKKVIWGRRDEFVRNGIEKMLAYALGARSITSMRGRSPRFRSGCGRPISDSPPWCAGSSTVTPSNTGAMRPRTRSRPTRPGSRCLN